MGDGDFAGRSLSSLTNTSQPGAPAAPQIELIGRIISVNGSQAGVGIPAMTPQGPEEKRITVGKFLGVAVGKTLLVGLINNGSTRPDAGVGAGDAAVAELGFIGEIRTSDNGTAYFRRGVTSYPGMGDPVRS